MSEEQETSLFYITAQYVAEVQSGQQPCLSDYLARYPRYVDAIADFVAYYHAIEEAIPSADALAYSTDASIDSKLGVPTNRAMNCQDERPRQSSQQDGQAESMAFVGRRMTTLFATATGQRILPSQLAAELDLSIDIILLLEQRAIAPATLPHVLCEQIAMFLQRPSTAVQEYLGSLDQLQSQSIVTKKKQQTKVAEESTDYTVSHMEDKPSFRAVVEASLQLSTEQRNRWCAVLDSQNIPA
jgi:hypothetical protein